MKNIKEQLKESTSDKVLRAFWSDWLEDKDKFVPYKEFKRRLMNDELAIDISKEDLDGE
jgi:hypothetical protein